MATSARILVMGPAMIVALLAGTAVLGPTLQADTLLIENLAAAGPTATERPKRGTRMASVESRFGTPASRSGPVGQPPITRWEYPGFVVYFEFDHVVHSVRR